MIHYPDMDYEGEDYIEPQHEDPFADAEMNGEIIVTPIINEYGIIELQWEYPSTDIPDDDELPF